MAARGCKKDSYPTESETENNKEYSYDKSNDVAGKYSYTDSTSTMRGAEPFMVADN